MPKLNGLSAKQQRFIDEYVLEPNASVAARRAGYSSRTAVKIGSENLQKPDIRRNLAAVRAQLSEQTKIDAVWVERNLVEVVERCLQHQPVLDREGNFSGEYRFDSTGATCALELLAKRFRMFVEKDPGQNITNNYVMFLKEMKELAAKLAWQGASPTNNNGSMIAITSDNDYQIAKR